MIDETKEPVGKKVSRRRFLKAAAAATIVAGRPSITAPFFPVQPENGEFPITTTEIEEDKDKLLLNEILSLTLGSTSRKLKEKEYTDKASSLEQIDLGLGVINDFDPRIRLLAKRYQLRQTGREEIKPLPDDLIAWSEKHGIYPESLALCLDNYPKAGVYINPLELINPGGMIMLACTETGTGMQYVKSAAQSQLVTMAFVNRGETSAVSNLEALRQNPEIKGVNIDQEIEVLKKLCRLISDDSGLNFIAENIPGSSAGAIGLQFMPTKALEIYDDLKKMGVNFNPFDSATSLIGAWYFLSKKGYQRGDQAKIRQAINAWNPNPGQIALIYQTAVDFYDTFYLKYPQFA